MDPRLRRHPEPLRALHDEHPTSSLTYIVGPTPRPGQSRGEVLTAVVPEQAVTDTALQAVDRQLVRNALRTLSIEHRQALFECNFRGASVAEAADTLGTSPGTVKSRLHYALRALRQEIDATQRGVDQRTSTPAPIPAPGKQPRRARAMSSTSKNAVTKTVEVGGTSFAYREVGPLTGVPVVFLHHFTAVLDDWDPAVVDGIAAERHVILVDLGGVGSSGGTTPDSVEAMADDAIAFLDGLGLSTVDLIGFSLGGMVSQVIVQQRPDLVRRVILAGTAPASDPGPAATGAILQTALDKAGAQGKHPKHFLFFSPTARSQAAADAFLARLDERTEDRDAPVSNETISAQLSALAKWEHGSSSAGLTNVHKPVLVVNGDNDTMLPTISSFHLTQLLPDVQLSIYPNSGHGGIFQHHTLFVAQALDFLRD